jgi:hypothetical protein
MQAVKQLALKSPFKLRMVQISWMKLEIVGMYGDVRILELDDDLHAFALAARGEVEQRVLVEAKLGKHAVEASVSRFRHGMILIESTETAYPQDTENK